jgi:hypothetical protein
MPTRTTSVLLALLACCGAFAAAWDAAPQPPNPYAAVGHLRCGPVGGAACGSATVLGPRRPDGRWHALTAAHCLKTPQAVLTLRDGTALAVRAVARDEQSDLALLLTDSDKHDALPFALLADGDPPAGTRIWQAGWGIDRPGVRKFGKVLGGPVPVVGVGTMPGHLTLEISTAIGDSGGGYFDAISGRLIGVCSKTTQEEQVATCYAGAASAARRLLR